MTEPEAVWPLEPPPVVGSKATKLLAVAVAVAGPAVGLHGAANAVRRDWLRAGGRFAMGALALTLAMAGVDQMLDGLFDGGGGWFGLVALGTLLYLYLWVAGIVWTARARVASP